MSTSALSRWPLYPNEPIQRRKTLIRDGAVVGCLVILASIALWVHDEINGLQQLGDGVAQAATSVQHGFQSVAAALNGVPVVGGSLSSSLRSAGNQTSGSALASARLANRDVAKTANLIGWLIFLPPALVLLARFLPSRVRQMRRMGAAQQVLINSGDRDLQRRWAERAAFSLPYERLLRHTSQPLTDLDAGNYDPLVDALLHDAGLQRRASDSGRTP